MLSMNIALRTLEYLTDETEYVPWVAAGSQLSYIYTMIAETELYGAFEVISYRYHTGNAQTPKTTLSLYKKSIILFQ